MEYPEGVGGLPFGEFAVEPVCGHGGVVHHDGELVDVFGGLEVVFFVPEGGVFCEEGKGFSGEGKGLELHGGYREDFFARFCEAARFAQEGDEVLVAGAYCFYVVVYAVEAEVEHGGGGSCDVGADVCVGEVEGSAGGFFYLSEPGLDADLGAVFFHAAEEALRVWVFVFGDVALFVQGAGVGEDVGHAVLFKLGA